MSDLVTCNRDVQVPRKEWDCLPAQLGMEPALHDLMVARTINLLPATTGTKFSSDSYVSLANLDSWAYSDFPPFIPEASCVASKNFFFSWCFSILFLKQEWLDQLIQPNSQFPGDFFTRLNLSVESFFPPLLSMMLRQFGIREHFSTAGSHFTVFVWVPD